MAEYFGIDVAKWNGIIDWHKAKISGKIKFAILKVTNKQNKVEESFERNYAGCSNQNIPVGVYRYVYAKTTNEAIKEAKAILSVLKKRVVPCGIWLDMEDSSLVKLGKTKLNSIIATEKKILEDAGYQVGVYCNQNWYDNILDSAKIDLPFWIAIYGKNNGKKDRTPKVNKKHVLWGWQYTSKGKVAGVSGNVDLNACYIDPNMSALKAEQVAKAEIKIGTKDNSTKTSASVLNKTAQWVGVITADYLNIRTYAGKENGTVSFSPLKKGVKVDVCDSRKDKDGKLWYYINYNGKFGFASSSYVEKYSPPKPKVDHTVTYSKDSITAHGRKLTVFNQHKLSGNYANMLSEHGCGICCTSFVLTLLGKLNITPSAIIEKAIKIWGKPKTVLLSGNGIAAIIKKYGFNATYLSVTSTNRNTIKKKIDEAFKAGKHVICWTAPNGYKDDPFSTEDHYVLAVGYDNIKNVIVANSGNKGPINIVTLDTLCRYLQNGNGKDAGWYKTTSGSAGIVIIG